MNTNLNVKNLNSLVFLSINHLTSLAQMSDDVITAV